VGKAGAGDFRLGQRPGGGQRGEQAGGQFARRQAQALAAHHRQIGGEIPVRFVLGRVNRNAYGRHGLARSLTDGSERLGEQSLEMRFHVRRQKISR